MKFFIFLLLLHVSSSENLPKFKVSSTYDQVPKQFVKSFFAKTAVKFHYVLRCPNRAFDYKIEIFEAEPRADTYIDYRTNKVFNDTYGILQKAELKHDSTSHFEFTVRIRHDCRGEMIEEEWAETMKCPTTVLYCQFYLDLNLKTEMMRRHPCNDNGNCEVRAWY